MFKIIKYLVYLSVIVGVIIAFIMWNGGDKIRWFGKKSEGVGHTLKEKSEVVGDKSDQLKEEITDKKALIEEKIKTVVEKAEKHGIIKREGEERER
ncbi:MAG: hypothetical protein HZA12_05370 [Nitrospirae bacterium]|nr:hypothetical protein [Nitrospirota bacterium]